MPADGAFASLVGEFASDAASRGGFTSSRGDEIVAAALIGFASVVDDAMAEAREPIRVVAALSALELTLSIFERGLPIGDGEARRDPRWDEIVAKADAAHWHLHGISGSELRLEFFRPDGRPEVPPLPVNGDAAVVPAPPQTYVVRPFEAGDASGVARAFYLTYGYHYDLPAVYDPSRLIELNAEGRYVSIVAVAENGEIAGHYALAREAGEPIADAGGAIVVPAHRGRDLLDRMRRAAEDEARAMGLAAYYSEPVTDHAVTQEASQRFGAKACGLTLGLSPRSFVAKHMRLSTITQRQSFMLYVRPLRERAVRAIYPPPRHAAMIGRIYQQLGLKVEAGAGGTGSEAGSIKAAVVRADGVGTIAIERAGTQSVARVRQAVDDLQAARALGGIFAMLPLEDPETPELTEAMESLGFFFSGVGPWMLAGRDALRLQTLHAPIDLAALTIVGDFGRELADYVGAQYARVPR